jgi:hypothetical protein
MTTEVSGADLLSMWVNNASKRAQHYRSGAVKFRQMAEAETDNRLRLSFFRIAKQYEELATATHRHAKAKG